MKSIHSLPAPSDYQPDPKRLKTESNIPPKLDNMPSGPLSTIYRYLVFSDKATTRLAGQVSLLSKSLRDAFSVSIKVSDIHTYLGLVADSSALHINANAFAVRSRFQNHELPLTHENKSIRDLARFVDIKQLTFHWNQLNRIIGGINNPHQPHDNQLERSILSCDESFDEATLGLIKNKLDTGEFFNSRFNTLNRAIISDRLTHFVGDHASRFLDTVFSQCSDTDLVVFALDHTLTKHTDAKLKLIDALEHRTFGQNTHLTPTQLWEHAVKLVPILGEPALSFALDHCAQINDVQLAYHAVKNDIHADIRSKCQDILSARLSSFSFSAGEQTNTIVDLLSRTDRFQQPATNFLVNQRRMPEVLFRAVRWDEQDFSDFNAFIANIDRLDNRSETVLATEQSWQDLLMQQLNGG